MTGRLRLQRFIPAILAVMLALGSSGTPVAIYAQGPGGHSAGAEQTTSQKYAAEDQQEKDENDTYRHSTMVHKLGSMLGMSTETASKVFEWANFAVLALAIGYALAKALPKIFRDRSSSIQKQLVDARTATEEASVRLNSVEERLSHLDAQIAGMKAQSEKDWAVDEARIKASVEDEKNKIIAAAEQEIAAASMHAQRQLHVYAAELAIEQAAKKLVITAETDRLLVQSFARRLGGDDSTGGQN